MAHQAGAYPGFRSIRRIAGTHLYTWVERGAVTVKCLAQEHNTMSPARARTQTARSGDERTNHEATAPPPQHCTATHFNTKLDVLYAGQHTFLKATV